MKAQWRSAFYHDPRDLGKDIFPKGPIVRHRGLSGRGLGWLVLLAGIVLGGCRPATPDSPRVRVSAAASLGPVLQALKPQIEADLGVRLELNLAGSGTLTRQITDGAPADAVLLAHPAWMEELVASGRVMADGRVDLLSNTLVVVGRGEPIGVQDLNDAKRFRRIAIGDPASVPAGRYAEQALRAAGVWDALRGRLVTTADVRAALAYAQAGEVDAAIVYATDVSNQVDSPLTVLCVIDPATHDPAVVTAAAVDGAEAGQRVIAWLQRDTASAAFAAAGFGVISQGE